MKLLPVFLLSFLVTASFAKTDSLEFMTPRDLLHNESSSRINLHNNRSRAATVYGLYVRAFSFVLPGGNCNSATEMYSENTTAGSFVMPTLINAGKSAAIGSNYLYNMIYEAIYYVNFLFPSSPPGCALPGCTWGTDTTIYNWCIHLGALAPVSNSMGFVPNVPPSIAAASINGIYNYNLISNYVNLGPISCNDQTLTCTVANQQTQSFS